jgi:hypothetical protein
MSASSVDPRPTTAAPASEAESRRLQILTCLVFTSAVLGMLGIGILAL